MDTPAPPKLSVIMPVYNGAKTLQNSVASVLEQSLQAFELIIVDDGSTDNSLVVASALAAADPRISVVSKSNGGASSARNAGLAVAIGAFVAFIDADDAIDGQAYGEALDLFREEAVDLVIFGMKTISLLNGRVANIRSAGLDGDWRIGLDGGPFPFFELIGSGLLMSANNKVYRRRLIEQHLIRFDEASAIMEDFGFVLDYLACANRVQSRSHPYYRYFVNLSGQVLRRRPNIDYVQNFATLEAKITAFLQKVELGEGVEQIDLRRLIFSNYILGGDYQIGATRSVSNRWHLVRRYYGSPPVVLAAGRSDGRGRSERAIRTMILSRRFRLLASFLFARDVRIALGHKLKILRTRARMRNRQ